MIYVIDVTKFFVFVAESEESARLFEKVIEIVGHESERIPK